MPPVPQRPRTTFAVWTRNHPVWTVAASAALGVFIVASCMFVGGFFGSQAAAPRVGQPASSAAETIAALNSRGLYDAPFPYQDDNRGTDTYLLDSLDPDFQAQENDAVQRFTHFSGAPRAYPDDAWGDFSVPTPGMSIDIDGESVCTLSFLGHYIGSSQPAALSAGHCMEADDDGYVEWSTDASGYPVRPLGQWDSMQPLGSWDVEIGEDSQRYGTEHVPEPAPIAEDRETDYSALSLEEGIGTDARIGGRYDVTTLAGPADLHAGMMVCKMGFRTKETCGPIISWNGSMVRTNLFSLTGDSGSPLYIKLGGNRVAALGILSGSPISDDGGTNDYITDFALLEPVFSATGMQLGLQ